ncbi:MAG: glutamine synthetase family protein [Halioglobus sp.]
MPIADQAELEGFLKAYPDVQMLEAMMPDMNGILRCKRIHRREFGPLFNGGIKSAKCLPLITSKGGISDDLTVTSFAGDPDQLVRPVSGTLAAVPWLNPSIAQVLLSCATLEGEPSWVDCRNVLDSVLEQFRELKLKPVVATELEFYLIAAGDGETPRPLLTKIPGTSLDQLGTQYCVAEDLWQFDDFLTDVREACEIQSVPLTVIQTEFSPGQWEINTHHVDDPLVACDHAMLLKRIIKGVAMKHGFSACFMAKPFADIAGSGLHIHASLYDEQGENVFSDPSSSATPAISDTLKHAIGGLAQTMADAMAVFAPNANSYRRFVPGTYAPVSPTWGYNHRDVALRIPVSGAKDCRVEHRVAGADANPYLVMALVLGGIHHGMTQHCDPGPWIPELTELPEQEPQLPQRWEAALDRFRASEIMPRYLGWEYADIFAKMRQSECNSYHAAVPDLDYAWYLRSV